MSRGGDEPHRRRGAAEERRRQFEQERGLTAPGELDLDEAGEAAGEGEPEHAGDDKEGDET